MQAAKRFYVALLALLLVALPLSLSAQSVVTGDVTGVVTDPSGAVVPNAQVSIKNLQTGEAQNTTTNGQGSYRFPLLKPGNYQLVVNAQGFQATTINTNVNLGQVTTANVQAGLASASTTVEVTAEAPLIQSDNANLSTTFNSAQIDNLPAPGGDTTSYAYTAPGITISTGGGYGGFSSYGLPSNSNLFTVNGNDNMDPYLNLNNSGASNLTLGANELQEVAVVQNGYSVQYGRQSGAQENITTKSGTNAYHGNLSYWYNSKMFNANDWFNNHTGTPTPHAVNNQWAASFGGHVIKDKLFFFADTEGLRYVLPGGGAAVFLPTTQFAQFVTNNVSANNPAALPFYQNIFKLYAGAPGANRATPVTAAQDSALGCGGFAANGFGTTTPCAQSFQSTVNNLNTEWLLSTRVDWNISSKDTLFGRYRTDHGVQATGTDPINPVFNANSVQPEHEGQLNETHVFGASATNQFILSGSWYSAKFGPANLSASLAAFPTTLSFVDANFANIGGSDFNYPQGRNVTQYQVVDDFSWTRGNHNLKFGVNYRRNDITSFAFGPLTSGLLGVSVSDFANGTFDGSTGSFFQQNFAKVGPVPIAIYSLGVYGQDQWKPTNNLSITAGLRVDRNANPTCRTHCFSRLAGPFGNLAADPTGATAYNTQIQTGLSHAFPDIQAVSIQPRLGIAYSLTPHTVIRTGVGLFTDLFPAFLADRFVTNAPNEVGFISSPGFVGNFTPGDPNSVQANLAASASAFQTGFANGASFKTLRTLVPGFSRPNLATVAGRVDNPEFVEWNFEVEQGIGQRAVASINYVGNYGYNEFNVNRYTNAFSANGFGGLPSARANGGFNQVTELNNKNFSNYNGITGSLRGRVRDYLQMSASYTYGKALDNCSNECLLPFQFQTTVGVRNQLSPVLPSTLNYGPADYDTRHSFNANYVLTSPKRVFNSGLLSTVLGGWNLSQTYYFHSGYPFSVVNSLLRTGGNITGANSNQFLAQYLGTGSITCNAPSPKLDTTTCFTDTQFAGGGGVGGAVAQTGFGTTKRNSFRGPHYFDTDMNLTKNFHLGERYVLGLGANAFNLLNHPNFDLPVNNLASTGEFGQIVSTVSPPTSPYGSFVGSAVSGRVIQLNAHFTF